MEKLPPAARVVPQRTIFLPLLVSARDSGALVPRTHLEEIKLVTWQVVGIPHGWIQISSLSKRTKENRTIDTSDIISFLAILTK